MLNFFVTDITERELHLYFKICIDRLFVFPIANAFQTSLIQEGPHSTLPDDEFFDAVEVGLDKIEEEMRARLKLQQQQSHLEDSSESPVVLASVPTLASSHITTSKTGSTVDNRDEDGEEFGSGLAVKKHWLGEEIDRVCAEQLSYARQGVGEGGNGWQLFADEGEMKMYRREEEVNGMVIDPLKACHIVKGVSAREMCHYFYSPEYRNDWESRFRDI